MSDSPKVKIYEIKSRIKNHDLPKARVKDKTIIVSKITKMNCPELLTVTSSFLDFHSFRKRHTQREGQRQREEVCSFLIFQILAVAS